MMARLDPYTDYPRNDVCPEEPDLDAVRVGMLGRIHDGRNRNWVLELNGVFWILTTAEIMRGPSGAKLKKIFAHLGVDHRRIPFRRWQEVIRDRLSKGCTI
jgi:hypothetical protein